MAQHEWTRNDDIVALYLWKYGEKEKVGMYNLAQIAKFLDIKIGSLKMRISNFANIAGIGGLNNAAIQSVEIYEEYLNTSEVELKKNAEKIIDDAFELSRINNKDR